MSVTITNTPTVVHLETTLQSTDINVNTVSVNVSNQFPENPIFNSVRFDTTPDGAALVAGDLRYSQEDVTLELRLPESTLQIGQEQYIRVLNRTGAEIPNGKLVYINGEHGNRVTIALASTVTYTVACCTIAMTTHAIAHNAYGMVTTKGLVRGLNTNGMTGGPELWLSTNGDWTMVKPSIGTARISIGRVAKEHPVDGHVLVDILNDKYMFGDRDAGRYSLFDDNGRLIYHNGANTYDIYTLLGIP